MSNSALKPAPDGKIDTIDANKDNNNDEVAPESDLSLPHRRIWVVTTAALPWRTGTAVNPLLRALQLTRGRPEGHVGLVIPWLVRRKDRDKVYGSSIKFDDGDAGMAQQTAWIRKYASERCGMSEECKRLQILFYKAAYRSTFGSIFPNEDICALIPKEEADVAILEEPEHLNWVRFAKAQGPRVGTKELANATAATLSTGTKILAGIPKIKSLSDLSPKNDSQNEHEKEDQPTPSDWTNKFNFVVGILHTNYGAYLSPKNVGPAVIAAPVLNALSALVVRAYCNRVIRLSATLPSYAPGKEVTCNVHGVRAEFIATHKNNDAETSDQEKDDDADCAKIYFIGKLLWAKGFDGMLFIEDRFRRQTGKFFPIDIYGSGPDEIALKRAFHGRGGDSPSKSSSLKDDQRKTYSSQISDLTETAEDLAPTSIRDLDDTGHAGVILGDPSLDASESNRRVSDISDAASTVFANPKPVRDQAGDILQRQIRSSDRGVEITLDDGVPGNISFVTEQISENHQQERSRDPLHILADVSSKSFGTGIRTGKAVYHVADSTIKGVFSLTFSPKRLDKEGEFMFDPPKTLHELRRVPIPARFLGVKDHALLRDSPHKIFLNPSVSEVLCTTTAEALAMNKFVIIPKHTSNEFFFQFPNCLAYETLDDCLQKIQHALKNDPTPLSEEHARIFTWEAATERLVESSRLYKHEVEERSVRGTDKAESRIAWLHAESAKGGEMLNTLFHGNDEDDEAEKEDADKPKNNDAK